jgi:hypothetical protein
MANGICRFCFPFTGATQMPLTANWFTLEPTPSRIAASSSPSTRMTCSANSARGRPRLVRAAATGLRDRNEDPQPTRDSVPLLRLSGQTLPWPSANTQAILVTCLSCKPAYPVRREVQS